MIRWVPYGLFGVPGGWAAQEGASAAAIARVMMV